MHASFLPALAAAVLLTAVLSSRVALVLGVPRRVAALLVLSIGVVLAVTLSPIAPATGSRPGRCDLSRVGPPPPAELFAVSEATLNVALFVPLGAAVMLVPGQGRRIGLAVAAAALPFAIEAIQLVAPVLARSCQTADVFDNLAGLAIGAGIAAVGKNVRPSTVD